MLKEHGVSTSFPAASDPVQNMTEKSAAELKVTEAEQRLNKHR